MNFKLPLKRIKALLLIYVTWATYEPHRKSDSHPVYINENSNHSKAVLRELLISVSKRLSDLSSTKDIFEKTTPIYSEALKKGVFNEHLVYTLKTNGSDDASKKQWKCKIIFNLKICMFSLKTNIGRTLLKLLKQHFPKKTKGCIIFLIISSHSKGLLKPRV